MEQLMLKKLINGLNYMNDRTKKFNDVSIGDTDRFDEKSILAATCQRAKLSDMPEQALTASII
jgi:hypothetical protein